MKAAHPIDLLTELVSIPSVSRSEEAIAGFFHGWLSHRLPNVERRGDNVIATIDSGKPGPVFLLNSHLDTVPAKEGWTQDPWTPQIIDDRLVGLGSGDAKASVAAMACAAVQIARDGLDRGKLIFAATCLEEVADPGIEEILPHLGPIDAALVGEPTSLAAAVAQGGLLLLTATAQGRTAHAARPHLGVNALAIAARDVLAVEALTLDRKHPFLGASTAVVTVLKGGDRHNVIPDTCQMTLDIRYTPAYTAEELTDLFTDLLTSNIQVRSNRLRPVETSPKGPLALALKAAAPDVDFFGSPTMSDWVFLKGIDAIKLGPGDSQRSHTPNESVELEQVERAVTLYAGSARGVLEGL